MIDLEREAKTQAEGEAGSVQGARHGTRSRVSRIAPWAKGRRQTAAPRRDSPLFSFFSFSFFLTCLLVTRKSTRDGQNRSFEVVSVDKSSEAQLH